MEDLFSHLIGLLAPPPARKAPTKAKQEIAEARSLRLGDTDVDYKLVRRRGRRGVGLKIDGTGLTVAASLTVSIAEVERVIRQHHAWVVRKLGEWSQRRVAPQLWQTGQPIYFLGERLTLMIHAPAVKAEVQRSGAHLFVKVKRDTPDAIEKAVVQWMKKEALPHFAQRAFLFSRLHGLVPPLVLLSSANGRWGSCNSRREVRLSWRLIKARAALIDYVVCHELAHLRHMNHSSAFWAEVERMCPDYLALKAELDRTDHLFRAF